MWDNVTEIKLNISEWVSQLAFTCSNLTLETLEQRCKICSKLAIRPPKRRQWRRFGGFIVNFEHISHLYCSVFFVNFEHVIAGWDGSKIRKVRKCRPAVSNETIVASGHFFFTEVALVQNITDIALLGFWLMLLPWMFISCYTTIFLRKQIFQMFIFWWIRFSDVLMFYGWERGHPLSTYATERDREVVQNAYSCVRGKWECLLLKISK